MTEFQDIDDFISELENQELQGDFQGFRTNDSLQNELNRLEALNKTKFTEENQLKLETRREVYREILARTGEKDE